MKPFTPDPSSTFETFLHNQKNAFPVHTAKKLVLNPFQQTNPFVISGAQGSGKSHLLKAIAELFHRNQIRDIVLLTPDEILSHVQRANTNGQALQDKLNSFEVLMIDDFHRLAQHPQLQETLLPCFEQRIQNQKQIILTCCGKLAEQSMLQAMLSRVQAGILVDIQRPDLDVRIEFLKKQNEQNRLGLSEEDLFDIATSCFDFKKIHGMMYSLMFSSAFDASETDRRALITRKIRQITDPPDCRKIIAVVAGHFHLLPADLLSKKREKTVVLARQIALCLCREVLGLTYAQLGEEFGGKHHSSVLYSIKKIKSFQKESKDMQQMLKTLRQTCQEL